MFAQMASTAAGVAVGSTIGHTMGHAITGMFSGGSSHNDQPQQQQQPVQQQPMQQVAGNPCEVDSKAFYRCLEQNNNDIAACQIYYDMLKQCMSQQQQQY